MQIDLLSAFGRQQSLIPTFKLYEENKDIWMNCELIVFKPIFTIEGQTQTVINEPKIFNSKSCK